MTQLIGTGSELFLLPLREKGRMRGDPAGLTLTLDSPVEGEGNELSGGLVLKKRTACQKIACLPSGKEATKCLPDIPTRQSLTS